MNNLDKAERILRIALSCATLGLGLYGGKIELYVLSGILFGSGVIGFCPLYKLIGFSSATEQHTPTPMRQPAQLREHAV